MGRPRKLCPCQEDAVLRRLLDGEKPADLAREFGLSRAAFSESFSSRVQHLRAVAQTLLRADEALRALPPAAQLAARQMADELCAQDAAGRMVSRLLLDRFGRG